MNYPEKKIMDEFEDGAYDYVFTCKVCGATTTFKADNMQIAAFRGFKKHDKENPQCQSNSYRISGAGATQEN